MLKILRFHTCFLILCFAFVCHSQNALRVDSSEHYNPVDYEAISLLTAEKAVAVSFIVPNSQADQLGIDVGDIILAIDDAPVSTLKDFEQQKQRVAALDSITVSLLKDSGPQTVILEPGPVGVGLVELGRFDPLAAYNLGCRLALSGNEDAAFRYLTRAVQDGYRDATWLETDDDLVTLRNDPRWVVLHDKARKNSEVYLQGVNRELYFLFVADQNDRAIPFEEMDTVAVSKRDKEHRERVEEFLKDGAVRTADDYFYAAMIFQHGGGPGNYLLARELALQAVELGPSPGLSARWLAAAAKDRYLISVGKKQWYGTQYSKRDGKWQLEPIDEAKVTDEERIQWDVPTLGQTRIMIDKMN